MRVWIDIEVLLSLVIFVMGCVKYSVREQLILSGLPESYREHKAGFSVPPTEAEVAEAIQMGMADKEGMLVEYAHTFKPSLGTYVFLQTPLYLISNHARERAREYRESDPDFIAYCRNLDVVRIALQEQYMAKNFNAFALQYTIILLRDGKRVESLTTMRAFKGMNPFVKLDKALEALLQRSSAASQALKQHSQGELRKVLRDVPPEIIADLPPAKQALLKYVSGQSSSSSRIEVQEDAEAELPMTEFDGLFRASELKKSGRYEVIFRTRPTANLFFGGDEEKRYPIILEKFK